MNLEQFKKELVSLPTIKDENGVRFVAPTKQEYIRLVGLTPPSTRYHLTSIEDEHTMIGGNRQIILTYHNPQGISYDIYDGRI